MWSAARSSTWAWMSSRCSGGATKKMRSRGIVSEMRASVSCSSVRGPVRPSRNCFGFAARERGHRPGPGGVVLPEGLRVARVARAPLADGCEEALQGLVQALLDLDVADLPGAVASLEVLDLRGVVVEGVGIDEDGVALDPPGIRGAEAAGVGVHALDLQPHGLRLVGEVDGVVEALAHLRAPGAAEG